jgi:hypothetical protein
MHFTLSLFKANFSTQIAPQKYVPSMLSIKLSSSIHQSYILASYVSWTLNQKMWLCCQKCTKKDGFNVFWWKIVDDGWSSSLSKSTCWI